MVQTTDLLRVRQQCGDLPFEFGSWLGLARVASVFGGVARAAAGSAHQRAGGGRNTQEEWENPGRRKRVRHVVRVSGGDGARGVRARLLDNSRADQLHQLLDRLLGGELVCGQLLVELIERLPYSGGGAAPAVRELDSERADEVMESDKERADEVRESDKERADEVREQDSERAGGGRAHWRAGFG